MSVTVDDIALELGRATPEAASIEARQWARWIDRAVWLIEARAERLGVDPSTLDAETVDAVVTLAVVAHVQHPDNSTRVSVAVDDASVQREYRTSQGRITIEDQWWADLGLVDMSGAFTVTPSFAPDAAWS